jgi:hypothetical protein
MDTSLIALFPEADPLVGHWRERFDPWAAHGIGAHITIASPFLPDDQVDPTAVARLATILARHSIVVTLATINLLRGATALHPSADDALTALTDDIVTAWPEIAPRLRTGHSRPYHLTVACSDDPAVLSEVTSDLTSALPIRLRASRVDLIAHDHQSARVIAPFPLAEDST